MYVASFRNASNSKVIRYNGITGAYIDDFVPVGSGGLDGATSLLFGPDGNLYVTSRVTDQVLRYNGTTGAFMGVFATGGDNGPEDLVFGPDGNLYVVTSNPGQIGEVLRFNGTTGQFLGVFATGFSTDDGTMAFGPDGNLYVTTGLVGLGSVLRFDGVTGQFLDTFVLSGSGGLDGANGLLFVTSAASVSCSVTHTALWPPNHQLVNVGLSVDVQPPDATLQVQVYANDNASPSDAADIGPDTLQLRAERQGNGSGRVYLLVVTATTGGQTAFDVCTVVVPHDQSARSIARVQAEAASAEAYYREFQTAPAGYMLLGEGPTDAGGHRSPFASFTEGRRPAPVVPGNAPTAPRPTPAFRTIPASDPTGNGPAGGPVALVDGYFALSSEEKGGGEADAWVSDLWLNEVNEDRLLA
jgi:hypothetical protein